MFTIKSETYYRFTTCPLYNFAAMIVVKSAFSVWFREFQSGVFTGMC